MFYEIQPNLIKLIEHLHIKCGLHSVGRHAECGSDVTEKQLLLLKRAKNWITETNKIIDASANNNLFSIGP